jgi:hypothetical protein
MGPHDWMNLHLFICTWGLQRTSHKKEKREYGVKHHLLPPSVMVSLTSQSPFPRLFKDSVEKILMLYIVVHNIFILVQTILEVRKLVIISIIFNSTAWYKHLWVYLVLVLKTLKVCWGWFQIWMWLCSDFPEALQVFLTLQCLPNTSQLYSESCYIT